MIEIMIPVNMPEEFSRVWIMGVRFGSCELIHKLSGYFSVIREGGSEKFIS